MNHKKWQKFTSYNKLAQIYNKMDLECWFMESSSYAPTTHLNGDYYMSKQENKSENG